MTYQEIINLALSYSDRSDQETGERMDDFLRVVESRVNRNIKVQKMSYRATINTVKDQQYYGLPSDFSGLRDIQINHGNEATTMYMLTPEQMNLQSRIHVGAPTSDGATRNVYYSIIADQIQIHPPQENNAIEIVYYKNLTPLSDVDTTNWLSNGYPDAYTFGLLVEISSFAKDPEAVAIWEQRFNQVVSEISLEDVENRWSGTPLQVRRMD